MRCLELMRLTRLVELSRGNESIVIGLIDGPVDIGNPGLDSRRIKAVAPDEPIHCRDRHSAACGHGTYIAGILAGESEADFPGLCPGCTILAVPVFDEFADGRSTFASPDAVGRAIVGCVKAGARLVNISAAFPAHAIGASPKLLAALDFAAERQVLIVVAAGNYGRIGGSVLLAHPGVIPVIAYGLDGLPAAYSNLGSSIGTRGIGAVADGFDGLGPPGSAGTGGGTSAASAMVTGSLALLWSLCLDASPAAIRAAAIPDRWERRRSIVPPLLDGESAYARLLSTTARCAA